MAVTPASPKTEPLVCSGEEVQAVLKRWLAKGSPEEGRSQQKIAELAGCSAAVVCRIVGGNTRIVSLGIADSILTGIREHYTFLTGEVRVYRNPRMGVEKYRRIMRERGCDDDFIEQQEFLLLD